MPLGKHRALTAVRAKAYAKLFCCPPSAFFPPHAQFKKRDARFLPVGRPHAFKNESGRPAGMLISVVPAGLEQMFFEVGQPVPEGAQVAPPPTREEVEKLLSIAPRNGIEIKLPQP